MTADTSYELQVFESDDGILLWGMPEALALIDEDPELTTRTIDSTKLLAHVGNIAGGSSTMMAEHGRWLRLDDVSVAYIKKHGVTNLSRGVLRNRDLVGGKGTQIAKHLRFQNVSLVSPGGLSVLSSVATQMAIQQSLDEVKHYLDVIDEKLDRLIKADKTKVLSDLDGFDLAVREAESIRARVGMVSSTTWSKIDHNSTPLMSLQSKALRELSSLVEKLGECGRDVDKLAETLSFMEQEALFWMKVLAKTIIVQDKQYYLEIERVAADTPNELEAHRQGIRDARDERVERITQILENIGEATAKSAELSNVGRVVNPINAGRVTRFSNQINEAIEVFATHAGIELNALRRVDGKKWFGAVGGMFGDAATGASNLVHGAGEKAGRLRTALDDVVVTRAGKILAERELRMEAAEQSPSATGEVGGGDLSEDEPRD